MLCSTSGAGCNPSTKILPRSRRLKMRTNRLLKILKVMLMVFVAAAALGFIVESLWNAVVSPVFGWRLITFWQALGLLLLSKILFGGFHRHVGGGGPWKRRM